MNGTQSTEGIPVVHDPKAVGRILSLSLSTVYKLFRDGKIRTIKNSPRRRVADEELRRFISEQ